MHRTFFLLFSLNYEGAYNVVVIFLSSSASPSSLPHYRSTCNHINCCCIFSYNSSLSSREVLISNLLHFSPVLLWQEIRILCANGYCFTSQGMHSVTIGFLLIRHTSNGGLPSFIEATWANWHLIARIHSKITFSSQVNVLLGIFRFYVLIENSNVSRTKPSKVFDTRLRVHCVAMMNSCDALVSGIMEQLCQ